ncbi:Membrane associated serine protease, rhomboid family [Amycolatopsis arida]|uniref:Membrane associated serine protease, rhomboid family n=1 Tax=Amycolatopsis arida TaxID=587909 RepID=A0A1I5TV49_9PSEU|nr:rhomboid family intramembrane serine protease [Amycolatopsis arida]TDX95956.1 membrane associated rhomboid family serine protease [Amycolatopsis arida]SFP86878.1 Membrane associated serine protease, rhomboid family [Amycolatopsis arida]
MSQPPFPPPPESAHQQEALPACWWHPNRRTGLRCVRCDRPACPECLREASVGHQCVDCVHAAREQQRAQQVRYRRAGYGARTPAGARASSSVVVTPVLIALNVLVYVFTAVQAQDPMRNTSALYQDGALVPWFVAEYGEWWRLLTGGFLHYGLLHIVMNMFALLILGRDLELLLGKVRFLALYFVSLLGGSVAVQLFGFPLQPTVGASGAIYGLLGAILVAVLRLRLNPTAILMVIGLNLVITFSVPNISWLGHLGGFVVGAVIMVAMLYAPEGNRAALQFGAVALIAVALVGLVFLRDAQLADMVCGFRGNEAVCVPGAR